LLLQVRKGNRSQSFYTMPEYEAWRESLANSRDANGWDIKYYKGAPQHLAVLCLA
jgi:DNA topoisomerase-2